MAASNFRGFSWTEEKSSIILEIMTHLVISKKLDVLADSTIEMVLLKFVQFKDFTLFRSITTQDVKEHLLERRKIYMRDYPEDTELINKSIPNFCKLVCIFGGLMPQTRRRR